MWLKFLSAGQLFGPYQVVTLKFIWSFLFESSSRWLFKLQDLQSDLSLSLNNYYSLLQYTTVYYMYSETSLNEWTPPNGGHLAYMATWRRSAINTILIPGYSVKWTGSHLSSTQTVQNSLDNADAYMPLTQDCPPLLIDSTTGHYNSTGMHSTSLWLAFLTSVQQKRTM